MKKLIFILFLSFPALASAGEIVMKINILQNDPKNPKMEYAFYDGDKKIANRVLDIMKNFVVIEQNGIIPDGIVKFHEAQTKELIEYTYKNNKRNGPAVSYYPTGEKSGIQNYKNDELEGLQQGFQKNGTLTNEYIINWDGQPSTERIYYENGKLKSESTYLIREKSLGNKTLTKKTYDENGNLVSDLKAEK